MGASESREKSEEGSSSTETRVSNDIGVKDAAQVVGTVVGVATVAYSIYSAFSALNAAANEVNDQRKKVKAPGRNGEYIYRDDFEKNLSEHFRNLRNAPANEVNDQRKKTKAPGRNESKSSNTVVEMIKWKPPPEGIIKINTDAGMNPWLKHAGFGGLARDHKGKWVEGFCGRINTHKPLRAELWGIRHGFRLACEKEWMNAIVESDAKHAVNLILSNATDHHEDRAIIAETINLMKACKGKLTHTKREGNRCADILARTGVNQGSEEIRYMVPEGALIMALKDDEEGREFPRGTP